MSIYFVEAMFYPPLCVFTPCWRRHIDRCFGVVVSIVEAPEKLGAHLQGTGAAQTLHSPHLTETNSLV